MEPASATFIVEHDDAEAGLRRHYVLSVWEKDGSVAMFDSAHKRYFLRRAVPPEKITLDGFYLGGTVMVCSRLLRVMEYADELTKRRYASVRGSACLVIKPDGYHHFGKILSALDASSLLMGRIRMATVTSDEAYAFFSIGSASTGAATREAAVAQLTADRVIAIEVAGDDVISRLHELAGPADPAIARSVAPKSIRAIFGKDRIDNAVHVSANAESAVQELSFFFDRAYPFSVVGTHCGIFLIKPHAVASRRSGPIIDALLGEGVEISAARTMTLSAADAGDYLEAYQGVYPQCARWCAELASGPCLVMEVRGESIVDRIRALVGPYDPDIGRMLYPKSLRALHGIDAAKNAIHVTDMTRDGPLEAKYFFQVLAKSS